MSYLLDLRDILTPMAEGTLTPDQATALAAIAIAERLERIAELLEPGPWLATTDEKR